MNHLDYPWPIKCQEDNPMECPCDECTAYRQQEEASEWLYDELINDLYQLTVTHNEVGNLFTTCFKN